MTHDYDTSKSPSGTGCVECLRTGAWWLHLRRCALCGHIGCCDSSPNQHATRHYHETGHPVVQSFEPGESWYWSYKEEREVRIPELAPPHHHPDSQPTPGPVGKVPGNWANLLNNLPALGIKHKGREIAALLACRCFV